MCCHGKNTNKGRLEVKSQCSWCKGSEKGKWRKKMKFGKRTLFAKLCLWLQSGKAKRRIEKKQSKKRLCWLWCLARFLSRNSKCCLVDGLTSLLEIKSRPIFTSIPTGRLLAHHRWTSISQMVMMCVLPCHWHRHCLQSALPRRQSKMSCLERKFWKGQLLIHLTKWYNMQGQFFRPGLSFKVSKSILVGGLNWMSGKWCRVSFILLMGVLSCCHNSWWIYLWFKWDNCVPTLQWSAELLHFHCWSKAILLISTEATFEGTKEPRNRKLQRMTACRGNRYESSKEQINVLHDTKTRSSNLRANLLGLSPRNKCPITQKIVGFWRLCRYISRTDFCGIGALTYGRTGYSLPLLHLRHQHVSICPDVEVRTVTLHIRDSKLNANPRVT